MFTGKGRLFGSMWKGMRERVRSLHADEQGAVEVAGPPQGGDPKGSEGGESGTETVESLKASLTEAQGQVAEANKRNEGTQRRMNDMLRHARVEKPDEFLARDFAPAAAATTTTAVSPEEGIAPWQPSDGEPAPPNRADERYEHDAYGNLSEKGERAYQTDRHAYTMNCARFTQSEARREDDEAALDTNLATQMAEFHENWVKAPEKWELDQTPGEIIEDIVAGLGATYSDTDTPNAQSLAKARTVVMALVRHIHAQELTAADTEAAEGRKGEAPSVPTGTPGGRAASTEEELPVPPPGASREEVEKWMKEKQRRARPAG